MNKIGVFADCGNLYREINHRFGRKLDYASYLMKVTNGNESNILYRTFAYLNQDIDYWNEKFVSCIREYGYEVRVCIYDDVICHLIMDIVKLVTNNKIDTIVIGSNSLGLIPTIRWAMEKGIKCIVISCNIPDILKNTVDEWVEIDERWLE